MTPIIPIAAAAALFLFFRSRKAARPKAAERPVDTYFDPAPVGDLATAQFGSPSYEKPSDVDILSLNKGDRVQVVLLLKQLPVDPAGMPSSLGRALLSEGSILTVPGPGEATVYNYIHDKIVKLGDFSSDPFQKGEDVAFLLQTSDIFKVVGK